MKIKNIQSYRTLYKESRQASPKLEEHFIGNFRIDPETDEMKLGFFSLYHGDKDGFGAPTDGIENFLQSFLDMAKDGQAVYEFLQNAVDAGSTHYTMIWGQDEIDFNHYLLVANNGKMFDANSVRSILNTGSSTKTADSQTIGKFGIGFKLAHRLVGKSNGLEELLSENSGPLLFSWKNYEIEKIIAGESAIPTPIKSTINKRGNLLIDDDNPWLFKILITCFPCLPENDLIEELPIMSDGKQAKVNPFAKHEYETFARWIKNNQNVLSKEMYNEGSIFFIKLGSGKETELAENNLKEGVKFALAILKETADEEIKNDKILQTVQLNNEEITYPDLEYIKLLVDRNNERDTYAHIRFGVTTFEELTDEQKKKINDEADIEILFGVRNHNKIKDYFFGAPNLYLYFPLSEEVHNFNYILHSNAFYKGSSRTFLHKGSRKEDGINERLLKTIVTKVDLELERLSKSLLPEERQLFLDLYTALLTSGKSTNKDRLWIETPYINPMDELLKKYIPVAVTGNKDAFEISSNPEEVFIKKTEIDIDTTGWMLENIKWFFLGSINDVTVNQSAKEKLGVEDFTLYNLLIQHDTINEYLNQYIGTDSAKVKQILSEIKAVDIECVKQEIFKKNLFTTNILLFNNEEFLSIVAFQEKEKEGYFIIYNTYNDITDILKKLDFKFTIENFDDYGFNQTYFPHFGNDSQVKGYTNATKLFSAVVKDEKLKTLTADEKHKVFEAFRKLDDSPGRRIPELKLLLNNNNTSVYFKNLFSTSTIPWLSLFSVNSKDNHSAYKNYLVNEAAEIYEAIIYPFWNVILGYINKNESEAVSVFEDIQNFYKNSDWSEKQNMTLSDSGSILFSKSITTSNSIYYHADLIKLSDEVYKKIQLYALTYFNVHIPDKIMLIYMDQEPFYYPSVQISGSIVEDEIDEDTIRHILEFATICNIDFFGYNTIIEKDGKFRIGSSEVKKQYFTTKQPLITYVSKYHNDEYELIPEPFTVFKDKVPLHDSKLTTHLIDNFEEEDLEQEIDFVEAILTEGFDDKKKLLQELTFIKLDGSWLSERQNNLYLRLLKDVVEGISDDDITAIHNKVCIEKNNLEIIIGTIDSAHDTIILERGDKKINLSQAQILNLENADTIKLVQEFHDEAQKRDLLNKTTSDKLFKISNSGLTPELLSRFETNIHQNHIENSHQLAFLLLCGSYDTQRIAQFRIKMQDESWSRVSDQIILFSVENNQHISPDYTLNESYSDLNSLLQLSDYEVFNYSENAEDIITSRFLFVKGSDPKVLSSEKEITAKMEYLFSGWSNLPMSIKTNKRKSDWSDYLKFDPATYVINGIHLNQEVLPASASEWFNTENKKKEFLKAIGVMVDDSPVDRLRKYLLGIETHYEIDIVRFSDSHLLNTLIGLASGFALHNEQFSIFHTTKNLSQIRLIENIINLLHERNIENLPVLVYHSSESLKIIENRDTELFCFNDEVHSKLQLDTGNQLNWLYANYNICKISENNEHLNTVETLSYESSFCASNNQIEHDEPFYRIWRDEYKIVLFRENELHFTISFNHEDTEVVLGKIVYGDFALERNGANVEIYYNQQNSLEKLAELLSEDEIDLAEKLILLITSKDRMLKSFYHTMNAAGMGDVNDTHLEALKNAFKEEALKQQRTDLIDKIKENNDYSHAWFESYLKLLLTFESAQDTTSQKTISFQEIRRYTIEGEISDKYFLLCGASSFIPLNIEDFDDFKISMVLKNKRKENIKVEGVSKKGQDLLIYCRESIPLNIIELFKEVVQVKISFTPSMDLLGILYKAFMNERYIDVWENINEVLPKLHFIYGPPGTGKTTTLCKTIASGILENNNAKYLILTPTNKAADVLCKKLLKDTLVSDPVGEIIEQLKANDKVISITRLGKPTDPELEEMDITIYQDSLNKRHLDHTNVLASSIHRIPYFELIDEDLDENEKLFRMKNYWDCVIFDEASMTNLPYIVFAILAVKKFNPDAKFIIAGDPKQIPPVVNVDDKILEELELKDENVYTMLGISSFNKDEQNMRVGDTIDNLLTQYRSVENIGHLFSELSYDKLLQHHRKTVNSPPKELPEAFKKILNQSVTFIDIPLSKENSVYSIYKLLYSSYHIYSAIFVTELVKYFDSLLNDGEQWSIGLISPYKAQAILLNKLITSYGLSDKLKIYSDTVHGFQGDECDIVFFIANPNNYTFTNYKRALLSKEYIYNVAISRAKDYVVIIHPFEAIKTNNYINSLWESHHKKFGNTPIKKSSEFEKLLFNQKDFIERNSYITGHDNVNVFGQIEMKYFIKTNESAIDIQLRKM
jgi:hypothetical protein